MTLNYFIKIFIQKYLKKKKNEKIKRYLDKFPFKVYLCSAKEEKEDKFFLSNDYEEYQKKFQDNTQIKKLIELIRVGYKIVIYITDKETIKPLNAITIIEEEESKNSKKNLLIHFSLHEKKER